MINQENYRKQVEQAKRLSPSSILYKTESRFLSPRRSSYYKDKDITELIQDPIAMAVEINREKQRSISTLKATQSQSKKLLQSLKSPLTRVSGPHIGLAHKFYSGTEVKTPNYPRNFKRPLEPAFKNVQLNFFKKRASYGSPPVIRTSKEIFAQAKHSTTDILNKNSVINRGAVVKASFPSYIGMTPEYENITLKSTMPSMTDKNRTANEHAKMKLSTGNFRFEMPREPWSPGTRNKLMNTTA